MYTFEEQAFATIVKPLAVESSHYCYDQAHVTVRAICYLVHTVVIKVHRLSQTFSTTIAWVAMYSAHVIDTENEVQQFELHGYT